MAEYDTKEKYDVESNSAAVTGSPGEMEVPGGERKLKTNLKGRHMQVRRILAMGYLLYHANILQMIAIGGSIGAGLFVGAGGALRSGGPGSLVIDFMITGFMLLMTVNALGELAGMVSSLGMYWT